MGVWVCGGGGPAVTEVFGAEGVADVDALEESVERRAAAVVGELQRVEEGLGGVGKLREVGGGVQGGGVLTGGGCIPSTLTIPLG